jgi:diguanylate cyclase (GGDEF)-like protein
VHAQLEPRGHTVIDGAYGTMAHDLAITTRPDLVVVDSEIAGSLPQGFLDDMNTDVRISDVPVIVANTSRITDLVIDVEVQLQVKRLQNTDTIDQTEMTDPLTGLYNAKHMRSEIAHFGAIAHRYKQTFSLVLVGLDRFERTNRMYGTDAGNEVLCDIAERFASDVRDTDVVGRWHADQFMAILPCTTKNGAGFLAERFRETLAESQHNLKDGSAVAITASFGCADIENGDIIGSAEAALRQAKRNGRNTVMLSH